MAGPITRLGPKEAAKRSSWIYTLLFLSVVCGIAYYVVTGFERSYNDVLATESNRVTAQPAPQPYEFGSRTESDQQRTIPFKNAVQNSPGLAASQQHVAETQKLMEPQPKR